MIPSEDFLREFSRANIGSSPAQSQRDLERYLHEHIPLSRALAVRVEQLGGRALAVGLPARQRRARDQLHGDECVAVPLARVVHRDDVGMRQLGERARLALDLIARDRRVGDEQLDRDPIPPWYWARAITSASADFRKPSSASAAALIPR